MIIARVYLHSSCSPQPPNKKIKTQKAGICDNWDQPYTEDPVLTHAPSRRSVSTTSGKSYVSMTSSKPTTGNATTGDDSDTDAIGGISDNEGDLAEQQGLAEKEKAAMQYYGGRNNPGKVKVSTTSHHYWIT